MSAPAEVNNAGWTLIELVVVLTLLGIIGALAVPRFFDRSVFAARSYAVELAAASRLARRIALASGCPVQLTITASGYAARQPRAAGTHCASAAGGYSSAVAKIDGGALAGSAPAGVTPSNTPQWIFLSDGTAQASGGTALRVGAQTLTLDPASGVVTGP